MKCITRLPIRYLMAGCLFGLMCLSAPVQEALENSDANAVAGRESINLPESLFENVTIKGARPGILSEEASAYFTILNHAREVSQQELRKTAESYQQQRIREVKKYQLLQKQEGKKFEFPAFVDLFQFPEKYVGKPVRLKGHARKYRSYPMEENDYGIEMLHELWLYTDDSQQNPSVIVCTEIPDDFPTQDAVIEGVEVSGFFFKMYVYGAQDTVRFAPMLLAKTVNYNPPLALGLTSPIPTGAYVAAVLVLLVIIVTLWRISLGDRKSRKELLKHTQTTGEVDLASLEQEMSAAEEHATDETKPNES